ncbi:MAG: exonuclease SbcCD subunit D [Candidatus Aenigmarchaeota archaeon]|nr:exonuclease SbcCD subunit D [Candidatus Aenigmarchaeota archaeon]
MNFKFAHIADCHLDAYSRSKVLQDELNFSFSNAIKSAIQNKVDFVLICGDLFNNASPSINTLVFAIEQLKKLKDRDIPVYVIAGSHDYMPSGHTILNVLNAAGLTINAYNPVDEGDVSLKLIQHRDTDIYIGGIIGRIRGLDKQLYEQIKINPKEKSFNIFMFHNGIEEFKPKIMKNTEFLPLSYLPKGFDYYAAGHIHAYFNAKINDNDSTLVFPGSLYPTNIGDFSLTGQNQYVLVEVIDDVVHTKKIRTYEHDFVVINVDMKNAKVSEIEAELRELVKNTVFDNKIVILKVKARIEDGKAGDVNIGEIEEEMMKKGALAVEKNLSGLTSKTVFKTRFDADISTEKIEEKIAEENTGIVKISGIDVKKEKAMILDLIRVLEGSKKQGQTNSNYEDEFVCSCRKIFDV